MSTKHTDSCLANAADDEPIFVLRAQDRIAPEIVLEWSDRALRAGTPIAKVAEARELARKMIDWQKEHATKTPD